MAEDAAFTASIFPPPPGEWSLFTANNLALKDRLSVVPESEWEGLAPTERLRRQEALLEGSRVDGYATMPAPGTLAEDSQVPETLDSNPDQIDLLLSLTPPRSDWIVAQGSYSCLGAIWPIHESLPPLSVAAAAPGSGISQLYPEALPPSAPGLEPQPLNRREALVSLLRSLLLTHYQLVGVLKAPPREYIAQEMIPVPPGAPPLPPIQTWRNEAMDLTAFMRNVAVNMQHLINEMRAPQAQLGAELYLKSQLQRRREQSQHMRRCVFFLFDCIGSLSLFSGMEAPTGERVG